MNNHSVPSALLQPLLFSHDELSNHFFRKPSERELLLLSYLQIIRGLLTAKEYSLLAQRNRFGRTGYSLVSILSILILKLLYQQMTMKQTLQLLKENENLRMIVEIDTVPSEATMSRLSRQVEKIVNPNMLHERIMELYQEETGRIIGHLSIDSTVIEAREKPIRGKRATGQQKKLKKRGRKKKGSAEEAEYQARKAKEELQLAQYMAESPEISLSALEKRCSLTAKQNSKGQRQWFIGYKAHMACDDFGVPVAFTVTGACVHDTQAAIPLMKLTQKHFDFLYALMDKGYVSADIEAYVQMIGRRAIIAQRTYRGRPPPQMDSPTALRYEARTIIERTNGELKDGYLPVKLYRKGEQARYDISLAILLTTIKKVLAVVSVIPEQKRKAA
ncbi:MAG: transposase [Spirochaetota bacterium]|nr:transposase [Spirochaetota bacterium]